MRSVLGVVAGVAVAGVGALVLGEYAFRGLAVVGSGALLGLFVAEAALAVAVASGAGRLPAGALAAVLAGVTAAGLTWAAWISTGHRLGAVGASGWLAVTLGAVAAALRTRWWRTPDRSRPEPAPPD